MAEEAVRPIIPITTPVRAFEGHGDCVYAVAIFPDRRRMVTGIADGNLCVWDLKDGVVLKKMEGHRGRVCTVAISRDGRWIASGDSKGRLIAWRGDTGEPLKTKTIQAHFGCLYSLDFSPDSQVLATGSSDFLTKFWSTETWQQHGQPMDCCSTVLCVRYSPSGEHLAIATYRHIQIWKLDTRKCIANFDGHGQFRLAFNRSLAWTPDGTRLLSGGSGLDPTIREWDASTWKQVGPPWKGHKSSILAIAFNSTCTLVSSASEDRQVRLWRLSDQQTIAIFQHSKGVLCAAFSSLDGAHTLSGGYDQKISEWVVPELPEDSIIDVHKVIKINPSSYPRLYHAPNAQIRKLRQKYISPPEAEQVIRKVIDTQLDDAPLRLLDTFTGVLCDREAQINAFRTSTEYEQLLSPTMKHTDFRIQHIKEVVVTYFRYAMLSHRWEWKEPSLQDIQKKVVYELNAAGGMVKLQSFCKISRHAGYRWAWIDTCCIDQHNNVELQMSLNSMFAWYHHSALTVVYLSDVPPSSKSGALAKCVWNTRGWTLPEFLAPKVILFYQNDWTLYLDDRSPNHKESDAIMQELEYATGIDAFDLVTFRPGMRNARDKLRWASTRITTLQEDIAYSLFGIFGLHLPILYGEKKQNALGRLLQEIVARSGDISALDWVGTSSEFNSCLPVDITSYQDPPCTPSSLSEDEIQILVSSLQNAVTVESASKLYTLLDNLSSPRFANCRLRLPCIAFLVTAVRRRRGQEEMHITYGVQADGLHDLLITTEDKLVPFSQTRPIRQTFLLVRPWNRELLELPDYADDTRSMDEWSVPGSPLPELPRRPTRDSVPGDLESHSRALRLIVRLGQPFGAIMLAQQRSGEYKRIAADHDIIARVKDVASVPDTMDVRTLEIL